MTDLREHAHLLAEAVQRCEALRRELSIAEARLKVLASEVKVIVQNSVANEAATMVRPFVRQGGAPAMAAQNKRLGNEPTYAWTPLADQLTREQQAVRECEWDNCRELYPHFHEADGRPRGV